MPSSMFLNSTLRYGYTRRAWGGGGASLLQAAVELGDQSSAESFPLRWLFLDYLFSRSSMSSVRKVHIFPPSQLGLPLGLPFLAGQTKLRAGSCEEAAGGRCGVSHDMYGEDREPCADEFL